MNKKISTRTGAFTALLILLFTFWMGKWSPEGHSPVLLVPYGLVLCGLLVSSYFLYHYYTAIRFIEAFTHCLKTLATIVVLVVIGQSLLFLLLAHEADPWSALTWLIMKTLFSFSFSGLLSALFSSWIFNTFTKK